MAHVTLNDGVRMPIVGFGVCQIPDPAECERCVADAIDAGCERTRNAIDESLSQENSP
jgi:diketogulonate reductase-like aldo/keto reductase